MGSIVNRKRLTLLQTIAKAQVPADTAEIKLNDAITLKRSLDMTAQDLISMGTGEDSDAYKAALTDLNKEIETAKTSIATAAVAYGQAKLKALQDVSAAKAADSGEIAVTVESPVDYNRSVLKAMPLSSDSMRLNVQYFSADNTENSSNNHAATVSSFVSESLSYFGDHQAGQASDAAQSQVAAQSTKHKLAGTLVICVSCTHKNARIFAPVFLDPDKAVTAWNTLMCSDKKDRLNVYDKTKIIAALTQAETDEAAKPLEEISYSILSGATYGSSFVGMVHILKTESTSVSEAVESGMQTMQETMQFGGWFASASGGFGVDSSFSNSVKNLLSSQEIQSQCTLTTMGVIPSIKSNQVKIGVKEFADFDPAKEMEKLAVLQGATASDLNSIGSAADAARTGQQMVTLQGTTIQSALTGLADVDDGANSVLDINSLMTALEDYVNRCSGGDDEIGVPINFFLKPVYKSMIIRSWLQKYYPNAYQPGSSDDNQPGPTPPTPQP
jgi:hypothetical protein